MIEIKNKQKEIIMNHIKLICLSILLLLSCGAVTAQKTTSRKQELSVYGKGFYSTLKYDVLGKAEPNNGFGMGFGIEYTLYLNTRWSFSTGGEYQQYRSSVIFYNFNDHYQAIDAENSNFDFYTSADVYKEKQSVGVINIPLLFRYETPSPWTNTFIFGSAGVQLGIPVRSKYEATVENLKTSGYFQQWDAMLNNPKFMGFGSWGTVQRSNQDLDIRNSYSILFELGFKKELNEKENIYLGYYADLGLNQLTKDSSSPSALIQYDVDNPTEFQLKTLFNSAPQAQGETYASKPKIRGFGIKIRYAFKL
nr:hypothetical protein [uncultured Draconibacterium sp.]